MTSRQPLASTAFNFPQQRAVYHGKVRDVYDFDDSLMMVTSDRYSAFDRNLALIPDKGQLLVAISRWWFEQTEHIIRNHIKGYPDPNVIWCNKYKVVPIEMVVRGYITGVTSTSLWHHYTEGRRDFGDFVLPDGLHKNAKLPTAVLTPSTKFEEHDRTLTPQEAVEEGLVDAAVWEKMKQIALALFDFGQKTAAAKGLILVDTKYEFGLDDQGELILIDEIHTPDSSRYWFGETYQQRIDAGEEPDYYDKEYLRLWFKERFDPYKDAEAPEAPADVINEIRKRYIFIYEQLTGDTFVPADDGDPVKRIEQNIKAALGARKDG
jgi:phosphoribosylaminoimidazole-succinocarboxamide synthase